MIREEKIKEWVDKYLQHIDQVGVVKHVEEEEGYKFKAVDTFQKNFNIEDKNFVKMLDRSIPNNNLVIGNYYFPKGMLLIFAEEFEKDTKELIRTLFDEGLPIQNRIDSVKEKIETLMETRNKITGKSDQTFMGLRFWSLLLGYRHPNIHNALKPREWRSFCKYVDNSFNIPKGATEGEQYVIYMPYIEILRKYINNIPKINDLRIKLTEGLSFGDNEFRWMSQDIIYVTARIIDSDYEAEPLEKMPAKEQSDLEDDEKKTVTIDDRFAYEQDLEQFFTDNLEKTGLGNKLSIYTDNTGSQGIYYKTDYGIMDILTVDNDGNFVVIELKRSLAADKAVNQLGRYMQWVEENLAKVNNKKVSGILVAHSGNKMLLAAARALRFPVTILLYKLKIDLREYNGDE